MSTQEQLGQVEEKFDGVCESIKTKNQELESKDADIAVLCDQLEEKAQLVDGNQALLAELQELGGKV